MVIAMDAAPLLGGFGIIALMGAAQCAHAWWSTRS
jgi:hypothetical protein